MSLTSLPNEGFELNISEHSRYEPLLFMMKRNVSYWSLYLKYTSKFLRNGIFVYTYPPYDRAFPLDISLGLDWSGILYSMDG